MYSTKILNDAVSAIIELADNVPDDIKMQSYIYHLLKLIRAAARDYPENEDGKIIDILGSYAVKIKKSAGGKIYGYIVAERSSERKKSKIIPMPITNAHCSFIGLIKRVLEEDDAENYMRIHKIEKLYVHKFFEYSDKVDAHRETENQRIKSDLLMAFGSELGRYGGYLKRAMKDSGLECDEIIV